MNHWKCFAERSSLQISKSYLRFIVFAILILFICSSCSSETRFEERDLVIIGRNNTVTIRAEIARTREEQSQGYMHRQSIKDGEGMLFFYEHDSILSFWMANTLVPLSIAFISHEGVILEIYNMEPLSTATVRSSRSVRYALEVPQNWFSRAGIGIGDRLVLDNIIN